jgi:hypothetical protein
MAFRCVGRPKREVGVRSFGGFTAQAWSACRARMGLQVGIRSGGPLSWCLFHIQEKVRITFLTLVIVRFSS